MKNINTPDTNDTRNDDDKEMTEMNEQNAPRTGGGYDSDKEWVDRENEERESGQGLAEYALILSLIALIAIGALVFLGGEVSNILSQIGAAI